MLTSVQSIMQSILREALIYYSNMDSIPINIGYISKGGSKECISATVSRDSVYRPTFPADRYSSKWSFRLSGIQPT